MLEQAHEWWTAADYVDNPSPIIPGRLLSIDGVVNGTSIPSQGQRRGSSYMVPIRIADENYIDFGGGPWNTIALGGEFTVVLAAAVDATDGTGTTRVIFGCRSGGDNGFLCRMGTDDTVEGVWDFGPNVIADTDQIPSDDILAFVQSRAAGGLGSVSADGTVATVDATGDMTNAGGTPLRVGLAAAGSLYCSLDFIGMAYFEQELTQPQIVEAFRELMAASRTPAPRIITRFLQGSQIALDAIPTVDTTLKLTTAGDARMARVTRFEWMDSATYTGLASKGPNTLYFINADKRGRGTAHRMPNVSATAHYLGDTPVTAVQ